MAFTDLGLRPEILNALTDLGYKEPSPIQSAVIPVALQGHDVLAAAQTGTGKTAGFSLPIIEKLAPQASTSTSPARHPIRALILAPTRELAIQVEESIKAYCKYVPLRTLCVYGGVNIDTQIPALKNGVEILVATPGRLLDHVQNKTLSLSQVSMLVLDEADRMLDMG
ncbi:MAG: DEAD/DEAH box helicase, partial [Hydrogenophilaceae bacterium]|nr:DEAD/DEAH box helicase [Hydrogenophilaceae bacterium]